MTETIEATLKKIAAATSTTSTSNTNSNSRATIGDPNCPHCHGLGFVGEEVPVGHPRFGRAAPCACRLEELQAAQAEHLRSLSTLGALGAKRFDNFLPEGHTLEPEQRRSLRRAYDTCYAFAENPRGWLLLHGGYGCGKTHLAAAIANYRLEHGQVVIFVNTPDLLDHLRSTFSPASEVEYDDLFDQVRHAPLLILDDLGAESPTTWAQEKLYQIFNYRYNEQLPTVITSNMELDRLDPRLRSRLVDLDLVRKTPINAPDFRRAHDSGETDISSLGLHAHQTFETFDLRKAELPAEHARLLQVALDAAREYADDPQGWLILTGGYGTGKTHLAAAIANYRSRLGHPALFITAADLLDHLRATFSPDSLVRYDKRFDEIKTAPLLVLDDLTLESATTWAKEKLFQLIDHRYTANLPTVLTTADTPDDLNPRLATRLLDPAHSVVKPITAPAYRGGKKARAGRGKKRG
ncbi:MAG: ATP-binding protein [Chloroflexi bacterium]|nr:ATP-binding protein [Chloroflexota bacterium]